MPALDLDDYRQRAARFLERIDREQYLHLAGHKPELELEPIYAAHAGLFERPTVEALREQAAQDGDSVDERRRLRYLLHFAVDGLLGRDTRAEAEELARRESSLEVEAAGRRLPYRQVAVALANEEDAGVRAELERAREDLVESELTPLHAQALERARRALVELGWPSYTAAYSELRGLDLRALGRSARAFLDATDDVYAPAVDPRLEHAGLSPLGELRRSDLGRFFRAPGLDRGFPAERLVLTFAETMAGLGVDLKAQSNIHLDTESRPTKTPRPFCSTPRVPAEIYLVVSPVGGYDDFAALFHEGGHTEHYAHVDPQLAFEFRRLGENAVTESFAFLLEHLTADAEWLRTRLGAEDPAPAVAQARASRLVAIRWYAAKIAYELELHAEGADLERMPDRYAELIGDATRMRWSRAGFLADVDEGFYVACYLRAWVLETHWRRSLRERFGERWFESAEAGRWLRSVWSQGQRRSAEELLRTELGEELDLTAVAADLAVLPG